MVKTRSSTASRRIWWYLCLGLICAGTWLVAVWFSMQAAAASSTQWTVTGGWLWVSLTLTLGTFLLTAIIAHRQPGRAGDEMDALRSERAEVAHMVNEALEMSRLLREVWDSDSDALILFRSDGNIIDCNQAAIAMLGMDAHTLVGLPLQEVLPPAAHAGLWGALQELQGSASGFARRWNCVWTSHAGDEVCLELDWQSLEKAGHATGGLRIHDRTEATRHQNLLSAARATSEAQRARLQFVAAISHEIRTPLNGINGMADLLGRTALDEDQADLVDTLQCSIRQLRLLLDDVLDLARLDAGRLRMESVDFDVVLTLERAVRAFEAAAQIKGLSLIFEPSVGPRWFVGDPTRITQIVNNLLDNAIKFTAAGHVTLRVLTTLDEVRSDTGFLQISVIDTGSGIAPELQAQIFNAYIQADASTARQHGGSGLGLALCRQLSDAMDAKLSVQSVQNHGSSFVLQMRLPLAEPVQPSSATSMVEPSSTVPAISPPFNRVLVVDDNAVGRKLIQRWLGPLNVVVSEASDGLTAARRLREEDFDLVLMDVSMPGLNGMDATRAVRALAHSPDPVVRRRASIPIIGVTAYALDGDRERVLDAGMNAYLSKPLEREPLIAQVRHWLQPASSRLHAPSPEPGDANNATMPNVGHEPS